MRYKNIILEKRGAISIIILDHPPANAWDLLSIEEFEQVIDVVENDRDTRVVILTGAGDTYFSAGFDVKDVDNVSVISPKARALWIRIDRFPKPVVAVINGYALGGGLELAMSCHFRFMVNTPKASIGLTELNFGIIPGWGGTQRLPRIVGRAKALDMIIFSKTLNALEALDIGLVDQVFAPEKLMYNALAFAQKLAERPPIAVSCVLKAMAAGKYEGMDKGIEVEAEGSTCVRDSKDRKEGFKAFLEKRTPEFKGE